jgi:hypothetical protein
MDIAVAYILSVYIFSEKQWQQKIWQCLMVGFILAGIVSDVMLFQADTWWLQIGNQYSLATAKYINKFDNPLLLSNNNIYNIGSLLILNSQNLLARFKEDKTYSLRLIDEPLTELWQIEKIQKK